MNGDELILTVAYQANQIRVLVEEIARLRQAIKELVPSEPTAPVAEPEKPV